MRQKRGEQLPVEVTAPSCVPAATKPSRKPSTLKDLRSVTIAYKGRWRSHGLVSRRASSRGAQWHCILARRSVSTAGA